MGPVTPLLAIRETVLKKYPDAQFVWVGTKDGPEKKLVDAAGIPYFVIGAGKWRRYFSLFNLVDLFTIGWAFVQSLFLLWQEKPNLVISAGGFVSVPLHWAAWVLGAPAWIHQQDVAPGLANKLMAPFAKKVTTSLQSSLKYYSQSKTIWIGNPARAITGINSSDGKKYFSLNSNDPVIFVVGGGTGSSRLNQMLIEALPLWPKNWQVIHLVGRERPKELAERAAGVFDNYYVFEFFTEEMKFAYAAADVVVARAGFNTITELALLNKAAILLPKEGHQVENASFLENNNAALILNEKVDGGLKLAQQVKELILIPEKRRVLGRRLHEVLPVASPESIIQTFEWLIK